MQAVVELARQLRRDAGKQVGPSHVPDEEHVAHESAHGGLPAGQVADDVADVLGGMPGGLPDPEAHVFDLDDVPLGDGDVIEGALRRLGRVDRRTGLPGHVHVARDEVRVQMGFEDVGDRHAQRAGLADVDIHVPPGVDHGTGLLACEDVGTVGNLPGKEVLEQHGGLLLSSYTTLLCYPYRQALSIAPGGSVTELPPPPDHVDHGVEDEDEDER